MDLQAILDDSDESSMEDGNANANDNVQSFSKRQKRKSRQKKLKRTDTKMPPSSYHKMDMDLERILRENDDDSNGSSVDVHKMLPDVIGKHNKKSQVAVDVNYFHHETKLNDIDNDNMTHAHSIANTTITTHAGHHLNLSMSKSSQYDLDDTPPKRHLSQTYPIQESLPLENVDENFYDIVKSTAHQPTRNYRGAERSKNGADPISPLEHEGQKPPSSTNQKSTGRDQYSKSNYSNPEKLYGVHDPEDWAVLQAILSEDDDDSDVDKSSYPSLNHNTSTLSTEYLSPSKTRLFSDPNNSIMERLLLEDNFEYDDYDVDDDVTGISTRLSSQTMSEYSFGGGMDSSAANNSISVSGTINRRISQSSPDVDAILRSIGDLSSDEDNDEDGAYGRNNDRIKMYKNLHKEDDMSDFDDILKKIQHTSRVVLEEKVKEESKASKAKPPTVPKYHNERYESRTSRDMYASQMYDDDIIDEHSKYLDITTYQNDLDHNGAKLSTLPPKDIRTSHKNKDAEELSDLALKAAENYEIRLLRPGQRDIVSPLMVKRRMKPKIELPTRSRIQAQKKIQSKSKQNRTNPSVQETFLSLSSQTPKFELTGVIQSAPLAQISSELYKNSTMRRHSVGLPTALAFNSKFIAIGTQRGTILVFDLFENLQQQLGKKDGTDMNPIPTATDASVTSLDLSADAETLISGYTSGAIMLWDVIKGSVLKSVTDVHPSPITSVRFLSDKETSIVSVDAGGLVNKLVFSKSMIWSSSYSVETECLLDGTAGQILAISVLPPLSAIDESKSKGVIVKKKKAKHHPSAHKIKLIALSSERSSFAVAVEPSVNVLHRWPRPSTEQMSPPAQQERDDKNPKEKGGKLKSNDSEPPKSYLPCLVWGWGLVSGMGHLPTPILARAWGSCLQLLLASFPPHDPLDAQEEVMLWPAFGIHDEFDTVAPVVALEWLGERSLVYLTVTNEFTVIDTVMMTLLERLDFSSVKLVYAEFSLSRSLDKSSKYGNRNCSTFQNSFRSNDNRLLVLCQEEAKSLCILGARRRVSALEEDGEWLEALALALDHYESSVKSLEDKQKTRDFSNHPEFVRHANGGEDEQWIADLLMRYLKLAVENAPESSSTMMGTSFRSPARIDLAKSHFQMLAGVCIEFCVATRRLDLLFGPIFRRFQSARYTTVFLDVLEPYVLNDKLHYIAPEAMAQFVEHCKASNDVATVERCLLHMDVTILDFDSILTLLRKNGMYSALLHVFTHGLDDFITPLEILMEGIFDSADECDFHAPRRNDGVPQTPFEQYGYKAILYIKYCFSGKTFPQGKNIDPEERVDSLRQQILSFLLQLSYTPSTSVSRSNTNKTSSRGNLFGNRSTPYPYLHALIFVDAKAVLGALSLALDSPNARFAESKSKIEVMGGWSVEVDVDQSQSPSKHDHTDGRVTIDYDSSGKPISKEGQDKTLCPDRQLLVSVLSSIILPMAEDKTKANLSSKGTWQTSCAKNSFLDFMTKYLLAGVVAAPKPLTFEVFSRMIHRTTSAKDAAKRRDEQERIISLLEVLPTYSFDREEVLTVVESAGIMRAALLLHKEAVADSFQREHDSHDIHSKHFIKAIDCYLQDENESFRKEVFYYVKKECVEASIDSSSSGPNKNDILRDTLCKKIPDLIVLDAVLFSKFIAEVYVDQLDIILSTLTDPKRGEILFKLLHAIISDDLSKIDSVASQVLRSNLNIDHHQIYLTTMAKFHPEMVYHHLSSHDNYRPDECLKLCQEYEIADASAYLLERMGNVSSALQLMLQTLEGRMMTLKRVIRTITDTKSDSRSRRRKGNESREDDVANTNKVQEIERVKQILTVALDLCERNSGPTAKSEHGSQLWFNVLDRLINAKGFLRLVKELPEHAEVMSKVLSELLQITMQRMVSNVPLPDLVHKITTDHSGNRLGEFREMIFSMLKTYSLELDVFKNAAEVMYQDLRCMSVEKRNLKVRRMQSLSLNFHLIILYLIIMLMILICH